ncbi:MAG: hypothetical protein HQM16_19305 [Deltaproteobacteria bacterium]|nr:hypothetical protein [Deltaproteobacteria bacterium]
MSFSFYGSVMVPLIAEIAAVAGEHKYTSAFGCGFEGVIQQEKVLDIINAFLDGGCTQISLADTAGHAHPEQVTALFGAINSWGNNISLACHFHNTYGLGLANCYAAYKAGVTSFESAFGGMGGCPFTKVSAGNVCTEDLVSFFNKMGHWCDINSDTLTNLAINAALFFNREPIGSLCRIKLKQEHR